MTDYEIIHLVLEFLSIIAVIIFGVIQAMKRK